MKQTMVGQVCWVAVVLLGACGDNLRSIADADPSGGIIDSPIAMFDGGRPDAQMIVPRVKISEVVVTPTHDWSGATPAYTGPPGSGSISSDDEYIELLNADDVPVDLRDWVLRIKDAEIKNTKIGTQGTLVFSAGSTIENFMPGGYLVIGNPTGTSSTDLYVTLLSPSGAVVDDVEIGGLTASRDTEGDGVGDGAPAADSNGFSRGAFDEAIARPNVQNQMMDSDNDIADFTAMYATPGRANINPVPAPENTPPQFAAGTTGIGRAVSAPISITFNEPIDVTSVDAAGAVVASVGGSNIALGLAKFADDDRTIILNPIGVYPFGGVVTVTIRGGATGIKDLVGNRLIANAIAVVSFESAPAEPSAVRINEVCATPMQDWNDSAGGNQIGFDGMPGNGPVTSDDEWIELLNNAPGITNFTNYTVNMYSGPTQLQEARITTRITSANARVVGSGTLNASNQGDRIVIGNPAGAIPASVFLELRNGAGTLVDHVEIGGVFNSNDRGGDGVNNGAPAAGQDGNSTGLVDETISRVRNSVDTGNDIVDWDYATATIGAAN
jgi:hypothetical protein